jgi:hypothetical protein
MSKTSSSTESSNSEQWRSTKTILAISQILQEIINENSQDPNIKQISEVLKKYNFTAKRTPSISISAYLERILKYSHIEESTLVTALIYIDKLCEVSEVVLTSSNVHR